MASRSFNSARRWVNSSYAAAMRYLFRLKTLGARSSDIVLVLIVAHGVIPTGPVIGRILGPGYAPCITGKCGNSERRSKRMTAIAPSSATFDTIVVGVGGMGSAACYHLARRGQRVLGLERFDIPHAMGSSHGVNRIIRLAYYEDPSYVPLLRRAYELWRSLQSEFGEQVLHITGSIAASAPDGEVFRG